MLIVQIITLGHIKRTFMLSQWFLGVTPKCFFTVAGSHLQRERECWKHAGDAVGAAWKNDLSADLTVAQKEGHNQAEWSSKTFHMKPSSLIKDILQTLKKKMHNYWMNRVFRKFQI